MPQITENQILHWQAVDRDRNMARDYQLTVSQDLFGWIIVERAWGRIGARQKVLREAFEEESSAIAHIEGIKRRRASAAHRIGVEYCLLG